MGFCKLYEHLENKIIVLPQNAGLDWWAFSKKSYDASYTRSLMEHIDNKIVWNMGFDLPMININRGSDHGLTGYLSTRSLFDNQSNP
ncbi:MAG: hypothetical protein KC505_09625 [Myxococcales bacterium]|nr:hypothetical protein [Myxococcales bacterium]USN49997.1 MAG: hypothetical protein H6731_06905 [Myxococcales bacterium]